MKKIVVFSMLVTFCCVACNKELSRSVKKENAPNISVFVENESEDSLAFLQLESTAQILPA